MDSGGNEGRDREGRIDRGVISYLPVVHGLCIYNH